MSSNAKIFLSAFNMLTNVEADVNDLPKYNISEEDRTRCLKDPLCRWFWPLDFCRCYENPCQTSYCYKNISEDKCQCSEDMCEWEGSADACHLDTDTNSISKCTCSTNFTYPLANMDEGFDKWSEMYEDNRALSMIYNFKKTFTHERHFYGNTDMPWIYSSKSNPGLPMDSIILWCSFADFSCSDFTPLYTALGTCYMFNYVGEEATKSKKVATVWLPGKQHGLTLFMRSSSKDFGPFSARQIGVRIFLHDSRSLPIVQEDGIDLKPGDMSAISMEYKEIHRLGPPWGKCGQDGQKVGVYSQNPYKESDCQQKCISEEIYRQCSCNASEFLRSTTIPREKKLCNTVFDKCYPDVISPDNLKMMNCSCPPACREKLYPLSLSSSKLNEDYFKLVKEVQSFRKVNGTPAITRSDFESSLLGVQIFYNSMIVTHLNETPLYSWESLLSNVGGNMGLFLGISLVTLLEVFEFLLDTIRNAFAKREKLSSRITPMIISTVSREIQITEENLKA